MQHSQPPEEQAARNFYRLRCDLETRRIAIEQMMYELQDSVLAVPDIQPFDDQAGMAEVALAKARDAADSTNPPPRHRQAIEAQAPLRLKRRSESPAHGATLTP